MSGVCGGVVAPRAWVQSHGRLAAQRGGAPLTRTRACQTLALPGPADFDAPPDELRGKEPHGRIRKAAKDALDAMFDLTPASRESSLFPCVGPQPDPQACSRTAPLPSTAHRQPARPPRSVVVGPRRPHARAHERRHPERCSTGQVRRHERRGQRRPGQHGQRWRPAARHVASGFVGVFPTRGTVSWRRRRYCARARGRPAAPGSHGLGWRRLRVDGRRR